MSLVACGQPGDIINIQQPIKKDRKRKKPDDDDGDGNGNRDSNGGRLIDITTEIGLRTFISTQNRNANHLFDAINVAVKRCAFIAFDATRLANYYVLFLLENGREVPRLRTSAGGIMRQFFAAVTIKRGVLNQVRHQELSDFVREKYNVLRPDDFPYQSNQHISQLLTAMANEFEVSCRNHVTTNFFKRLHKWFLFKLSREIGFLRQTVLSKISSALVRSIKEDADIILTERLQEEIVQDSDRLVLVLNVGQNHQQLTAEMVELAIQEIHTEARDNLLGGQVGFDENTIKNNWESFLQPLHRILRTFVDNMAEDIEERQAGRRRGKSPLRLFTILPITHWKQRYIQIDTSALHDILRYSGLTNESKLSFLHNRQEHWSAMFNLSKVTSNGRHFGYSIKTDGVSVSVNI